MSLFSRERCKQMARVNPHLLGSGTIGYSQPWKYVFTTPPPPHPPALAQYSAGGVGGWPVAITVLRFFSLLYNLIKEINTHAVLFITAVNKKNLNNQICLHNSHSPPYPEIVGRAPPHTSRNGAKSVLYYPLCCTASGDWVFYTHSIECIFITQFKIGPFNGSVYLGRVIEG